MGARSMDYRVVFVENEDLPNHQDWALIRTQSLVIVAVKRHRVTPDVLEAVWTAYRSLATEVTGIVHPLALVG